MTREEAIITHDQISRQAGRMGQLSKDEAYAVAEFIDCNIFDAIRNETEWDSFQSLRNLIHAYEKCCEISGFVGLTDPVLNEEGEQ